MGTPLDGAGELGIDQVGLDTVLLLQTSLGLGLANASAAAAVAAPLAPPCGAGNCRTGAAGIARTLTAALLSVSDDAELASKLAPQASIVVTALISVAVVAIVFPALASLYSTVDGWKAPSSSSLAAKPLPRTEFGRPLLMGRLVTAMTTITEGYDLVCISGALAPMEAGLGLTATQSAWAVGCQGFAMAGGAPIGGWLADCVGRMPALTLAYATMAAGSLIMAFSGSFAPLFLGRVVQGIGMGAALSISTAYVTEIAPAAIRGTLPSLEELFISFGCFLAYVANYGLGRFKWGWRLMLGLGAALPLLALPVLLLGLPPESPRYLLMRGRAAEGKKVLESLVEPEEAQETLSTWSSQSELGGAKTATWVDVLWRGDPATRRAFRVGVGMLIFQLVCGSNLLGTYATTVLAEDAGQSTANLAMTAVALSRFFVCIPAVFMMDTLGRRAMLLAGATGTLLVMVLLAVVSLAGARAIPWSALGFNLWYVFYSPGTGSVAYVLAGEVMENSLRSKGMSLGICCARIVNGIMVLGYPMTKDHLGDGATFGILALINAAGLLLVILYVPETKGVKLESMSRCFDDMPESPAAGGQLAAAGSAAGTPRGS